MPDVHYRPAGQADLACGADHQPCRLPMPDCCTTQPGRVTCLNCQQIITGPSSAPPPSATSPGPVTAPGATSPAGAGGSAPERGQDAPGTAEPQVYLQLGGRRPGLYVDGERVS